MGRFFKPYIYFHLEMGNSTYLASKPRYEILDGLRGVAALMVVAFHLLESYSKGPDYQIINHGYLAVDFFFCLSGFVIGYAYDDRWNRMSLSDFFKRRLVRLHPMVIMGSIVGALMFYFGCGEVFPIIETIPWWQVVLAMILGFTLLPALQSWDIRGWNEMHPLNGPAWSLFWEYIANILYALFIRKFSKTMLAILVAFFAFLTLDLTLNIDTFNLLANRTAAANTVIGGWAINPEQCYIGLTRLLYPFFCGLLISRIGRKISVKAGFWWCSLIVAVTLAMPFIEGGEKGTPTALNGIYNAASILLIFPLVVMMGAGSKISGRKSIAVCKFLGDISYPLYLTHYPLIYAQMSWAVANKDLPTSTHVFMGIATYIIAIGIAYAALKLYDEPVRNYLRSKLWRKN